ncbi:MAG: hypothetical protein WC650_05615 [Candidatus Doudnabacteria bacterium]
MRMVLSILIALFLVAIVVYPLWRGIKNAPHYTGPPECFDCRKTRVDACQMCPYYVEKEC